MSSSQVDSEHDVFGCIRIVPPVYFHFPLYLNPVKTSRGEGKVLGDLIRDLGKVLGDFIKDSGKDDRLVLTIRPHFHSVTSKSASLSCRFGVDVPVILRSSDESESVLPTPEKHMVQVTNPFGLQVGRGPASVSGGLNLTPRCLQPCVLTCFWGCEITALQGALHAHRHSKRISTPRHMEEALQRRYLHCDRFTIRCEQGEEHHTQIPADRGVTDLGPMPRERYPLVAVLMLTEQDARETHDIVVSVSVLHVPDDRYSLSARVLFQYLLTSQGNMYELKPLFMSADSGETSSVSEQSSTHESREAGRAEQSPVLEEQQDEDQEDEELWSAGEGRDCVVCQNAAVNRVLLPCRHACVCDGCVARFQHCPICRAFILESFSLHLDQTPV